MTINLLVLRKMPIEQEAIWKRVVNLYEKSHDAGKGFAVDHSALEGVWKRTICSILKCPRGSQKPSSEKKAKPMI